MSTLNIESPAVQSYVTILQAIISRMASNSAACKTWCITLVSAILVIVADKGKPEYVWITMIPIVLFLFLDSYYLGLERFFREVYNTFINKLQSDKATINDVFTVGVDTSFKETITFIFRALWSVSIWPFYGLLGLMLIIIRVQIF
ncbi:MAG: hypothetical protein U1F76_12795 [Candidatus Competibacteraceae bacterium]